MTARDVIYKLKALQGERSIRAFARSIPCSPPYLSDIYRGRREPGKRILDFLGITKTVKVTKTFSYARKDDGK